MKFKFTKQDEYLKLHPNIVKYMPSFVSNRIKSFEKLKAAVNAKDHRGIRDFCHNNIGVAGSYKCFKLEEITLYIQVMARSEDIQSIERVIPSLEEYLEELKANI